MAKLVIMQYKAPIETIPRTCGDCVDLAIIHADCSQAAHSFYIRTWTVLTLFQHTDADHLQSTRKCCFNSFCVVAAVIERIHPVLL